MTDIFSKKKRSEIMRSVRSKNSKIEIELRKALWKEGFRYRKNDKNYFGKPDLVFKKFRTVIFIDSCFWHGCKKHKNIPLSNNPFWVTKINKNRKRDKAVNKYYKNFKWNNIRIWEHDIYRNKENVIKKIIYILSH